MAHLFSWNLTNHIIETFALKDTLWSGPVVVGGLLLCIIIPYLLGSLNFGLIISKNKFHDDVRTHGSGNAGTTNMLRTYGKKAAVLTMLGDMLKAVVAVLFGYLVAAYAGGPIAGLFVMIGHMFPCFFKFKGGKGVATAGMVILMISPISFVICFIAFVIIVVGTKFVSLGSIMGLILYPIILHAFNKNTPGGGTASIMAVIMATLVVVKHKDNIKRLLEGKESKLSLGKKKDPQPTEATAEAPVEPEQEYQFVTCVGCGRTIPQTRKVCAYCKTKNPHYIPENKNNKHS